MCGAIQLNRIIQKRLIMIKNSGCIDKNESDMRRYDQIGLK